MRVSLRVVQVGALAVALAVSFHTAFELDRFLVPKEIVLHLCAVLAGLFAWGGVRRLTSTRMDWMLVGYVALSAGSVLFATNRWLGLRALAISVSALVLFWVARALREAGLERQMLAAIALAVVAAAVTALVQAYGIESLLFARLRAPGGTLGNRNFVGHAAAFGLPVVVLAALRASRAWNALFASLGVTIVTGTLVLTRSRAAWLAAAAVGLVVLFGVIASPALRRDGRTWMRLALLLVVAGGGVAAAILVPNALRWRSDNPYLDSVRNVTDYEGGSGRGRLVQYTHSLRMAVSHPLLGVGPGNWPVVYPEHAARNDPSLDPSNPGMTFNPWPSSDWVSCVSERGFLAAAILLLVWVGLAAAALRALVREPDVDGALCAVALLGTLAGAGIAGAFDAVLLLPLPVLFVWTTLGALWRPVPSLRAIPAFVVVPLVVLSMAGAVRSVAQIAAIDLYTGGGRASLERAARIDPGNERVHLRLARSGKRSERCAHASAASALYPSSAAARALLCR